MGASSARNKALSLAQGDYIQWLDADDLLAPDKISEQMKFAESGQSSLTLLSSSHGHFYWRLEKARYYPDSLWQDLTPVKWLINKFSENLWMNPGVWLISRRLSEQTGLWDERLSLDDDGEYFSRMVALSEFVKFVGVKGTYYRQSGYKQLSRGISDKAFNSMLLSVTLCIGYLRSLEDSERTRRACLQLLQSHVPFLYLESSNMLDRLNDLILELGGTLKLPRFGLKHDIFRFLFGEKIALRIISKSRKLKLLTKIKWDEVLYRKNGLFDEKINFEKFDKE